MRTATCHHSVLQLHLKMTSKVSNHEIYSPPQWHLRPFFSGRKKTNRVGDRVYFQNYAWRPTFLLTGGPCLFPYAISKTFNSKENTSLSLSLFFFCFVLVLVARLYSQEKWQSQVTFSKNLKWSCFVHAIYYNSPIPVGFVLLCPHPELWLLFHYTFVISYPWAEEHKPLAR